MFDNKELIDLVLKAQWWDIDARNKIIIKFYPSIINRAKKEQALIDDLPWFAVLRLNDAINKFDIKKSNWKFTSYAWSYIVNWMRLYQSKYMWPLTMPSSTNPDIWVYNKIIERYFSKYWHKPSKEEIKAMSWWWDIKFDNISNLIDWNYWYYDNETLTYKAEWWITSPSTEVTNKMLIDAIKEYASYLPKVESEIFKLRFLDWKILKDISKEYWFTWERVRQLSEQALSKIKKWLWNMK